jgi:heat shock protein HslJ
MKPLKIRTVPTLAVWVLLFFRFMTGWAGDADEPSVYWVNSLRVPCVGAGPMHCLLIQKNEEPDPDGWITFYGTISGFDFEPGYLYKLLVDEKKLPPGKIPADAAGLQYALVRVLEKVPDEKLIMNGIWYLEDIGGKPLSSYQGFENLEIPQLEIKVVEMRFLASDGCNRLIGRLTELNGDVVRFGMAAGTRRACPHMEVPDLFNRLLPRVTTFAVTEGRLHLFDQNGKELMQFK